MARCLKYEVRLLWTSIFHPTKVSLREYALLQKEQL